MRVCQFRHDGKWTYIAAAVIRPPDQEELHQYSTGATPRVKPTVIGFLRGPSCPSWLMFLQYTYPSFAFIVILAFSTFDTGHPFSAASAYFWNVAASAPGTFPTTSM
jgi:hypothetical protein